MNNLPVIKIQVLDKNLDLTTRDAKLKVVDGVIYCSDIDAIDYYGEYRGNTPWIAPQLEQWAKEQGGHWEWENAEQISFTK